MRGLWWMTVSVMLVALPWRARAAVDWLTIRGTCPANLQQLAQRIEREVAGQRSPALALSLEIKAGAPVRGRLLLRQGARELGEKQVEAPTCEAALDLLAAIGALALSSWPESDATSSDNEPAVAADRRPAKVAAHTPTTDTRRHQDGDPRLRRDPLDPGADRAQRWRVLASAGIALGASAPTTLLVTGGAALSAGPGEVRLLGRYGAPSSVQEVEASARSVRQDFGAAAVDYCYGLDRGRWLSLCGGLELVTRRERRVETSAQAGKVEVTRRAPLLGPSAGLLLVLRRVAAQPQLELAALVPVWGAAPGFGFRASLGGGLPF